MKPVLVLGGGPAGAQCARALVALGFPVVLLEARLEPRARIVETVSVPLRRELADLDLPAPARPRDLENIYSAWGGDALEGRPSTLCRYGVGGRLSRTAFDEGLLAHAEAAGVDVRRGHRARGGRRDGRACVVSVKGPAGLYEISVSFVVEAVGALARSPVLPDNGRIFADDLVCLHVEVEGEAEREDALVETAPDGWWYVASHGRRVTLALFTDADLAPAGRSAADDFAAALARTRHISARVGALGGRAPKATSARTSVRRRLWSGPWLAIGDAARTVDPLSGWGVGRAFADGRDAARAVGRALYEQDDAALRAFALDRIASFACDDATRRSYYSLERRWPASPFWRRRLDPV